MINPIFIREAFTQKAVPWKCGQLSCRFNSRKFSGCLYARKRLLLTVFLTLCRLTVSAQTDSVLGRFSAYENEGVVYLNWSIRSGSTCDGIRIYRSPDSLRFSQIGEITGVCGSTSFEQSYDFTDSDPITNTKSYYRLELGNLGFTRVISIEVFNISNTDHLIHPNPCDRQTTIRFSNESSREHRLALYDSNGRVITELMTQEEFVLLDVSLLPSGIYLFVLAETGKEIRTRGRIFVQH
ncbi:MAG: hypothetical protein RL021_386 [Bacteroidota bacterium]|jgi:hypothetical protein